MPKQDYVILLGLLRRTLTDDEVHDIAAEPAGLAEQGEVITTADVERLINEATLDQPSSDDIRRVSCRRPRAAGRWPTPPAAATDSRAAAPTAGRGVHHRQQTAVGCPK